MRLSEAIRLGSLLHPQTKRALFFTNFQLPVGSVGPPDVIVVATCALGAALMATVGYEPNCTRDTYGRLGWMSLLDTGVRHPVTGHHDGPLSEAITTLNDCYGWTREQIADWVETVEQQLAADVATPVEVPVCV